MLPNYLYVETKLLSGKENMDIDVFLLDIAIKYNIQAILRLYTWPSNVVSIGRNQNSSIISNEKMQEHKLEIVRRPSGGRAVLHFGDISYSYITRVDSLIDGNSVLKSYKNISSGVILGLSNLGIDGLYLSESKDLYTKSNACVATTTTSDIEYNGYKIVGSAQLRKAAFLLQHGSIQIQNNKDLLCSILDLKIEALKSISIQEILLSIPDTNKIFKALKSGFEDHFNTIYNPKSLQELGYKVL